MRPPTGHQREKVSIRTSNLIVVASRTLDAPPGTGTHLALVLTRVCDYQTNTSALPTQNGIAEAAETTIGHC